MFIYLLKSAFIVDTLRTDCEGNKKYDEDRKTHRDSFMAGKLFSFFFNDVFRFDLRTLESVVLIVEMIFFIYFH